MMDNWDDLFDNWDIKKVSKTDKSRSAYVLTAGQAAAVAAAKITPAKKRPGPPFEIKILFDPSVDSVEASYYLSKRSKEADRKPEPRMGRTFVSSWMQVGEKIVIGNIGTQLYAAKIAAANFIGPAAASEIAKKISSKTVLDRASKATGKPARRFTRRAEFVRNPYVAAGAILRSKGRCEMPGCLSTLFSRNDGVPFLEVHHVVPLAEGGDDTLSNAAALCPMCHRELHFGGLRVKKRKLLAAKVAKGSKSVSKKSKKLLG